MSLLSCHKIVVHFKLHNAIMDSVVTETEVLIVGASTTGLVAAIALQKYGVSFRLIEKAPTAKKYGPIDCV